ncbi:hypothetical protein B0T22DRAFT_242518 [Podospora appendiculata]|uniref:Uncharacterized protein n=1 Tax=Podospora appendiculata TaxID=314037 RepID=A0AAE0X749_9PEZI|nr:hypothetical protein B0T22DRAFT_242518 [Podospora appendiculata]
MTGTPRPWPSNVSAGRRGGKQPTYIELGGELVRPPPRKTVKRATMDEAKQDENTTIDKDVEPVPLPHMGPIVSEHVPSFAGQNYLTESDIARFRKQLGNVPDYVPLEVTIRARRGLAVLTTEEERAKNLNGPGVRVDYEARTFVKGGVGAVAAALASTDVPGAVPVVGEGAVGGGRGSLGRGDGPGAGLGAGGGYGDLGRGGGGLHRPRGGGFGGNRGGAAAGRSAAAACGARGGLGGPWTLLVSRLERKSDQWY